MAGGGEKRRKLGIDIEWEKLLPSGPIDDEPPPIIVIQKAGERREQVEEVVLDDEEEVSHSHMDLSHISDMELMETIARLRNLCRLKLSDGGEKVRASLKAQEAELQRRKDDDTSRHATLSVDALAHDTTDDSTLGAPHPIPAPQSIFAAHFCRNLDEEKVTKSFSEELSTLNHSHPRSIRLNVQLSIHGTQRIGLSSRQVPFRSPCHLSSTSSHSEKDMPCSSGKKECNPRFQPLRSSRRTNKAVVLVDEEELEVDVKDQPYKKSRSSKDCSIYYPSRYGMSGSRVFFVLNNHELLYSMVRAMVILEDAIKSEYLRNEWWYWSSPSTAAKITTLSALALRIYSLDAAICYDKPFSCAQTEILEPDRPLNEEAPPDADKKNATNSSPVLQKNHEQDTFENLRTRSRTTKRKRD